MYIYISAYPVIIYSRFYLISISIIIPGGSKLRLFAPQVLHHMVLQPPQRRSCPPCNLFRVPVFVVCCFLWYCTLFVCERGREVCQNIKQHQLHYHLCFFWLHLDQLSSYIHTHPLQSTDHPLPRVFCSILLAANHQKSIGYRIFKRLQKENQSVCFFCPMWNTQEANGTYTLTCFVRTEKTLYWFCGICNPGWWFQSTHLKKIL